MTYPDGAVVLDNPPFSILSKIIEFYETHHIDYFLFAPALTLFNCIRQRKTRVVVAAASLIYANGAHVNTSFLTSLGEAAVTVAPDLYEQVAQASRKNWEDVKNVRHVPSYSYPTQVATAALLGKLARFGQALEILPDSCIFVRYLDSQKEAKKTIFGGGLLLSEKAAAEKAAAHVWQLSEREQAIIQGLK